MERSLVVPVDGCSERRHQRGYDPTDHVRWRQCRHTAAARQRLLLQDVLRTSWTIRRHAETRLRDQRLWNFTERTKTTDDVHEGQ